MTLFVCVNEDTVHVTSYTQKMQAELRNYVGASLTDCVAAVQTIIATRMPPGRGEMRRGVGWGRREGGICFAVSSHLSI